MDRLPAIESSLSAWQARILASRAADAVLSAPWDSPEEPNSIEAVVSAKSMDPATEKQLTLHLMSHIDAECFISLLQTMDPMPYDYRARAEYKRFYRQLHEVLEVPPPLPNPQPVATPSDPLR
jgi:hypothetical protein